MGRGRQDQIKGLELRTVGSVEPDGGDGRGGREGHRTSETRQAKDETQRAYKPDYCKANAKKTASALMASPMRREEI